MGRGGQVFFTQPQHPDMIQGHGRNTVGIKDLYRGFPQFPVESRASWQYDVYGDSASKRDMTGLTSRRETKLSNTECQDCTC